MHTLQVRKYALVVLSVGWLACGDETPGVSGGGAGTSGATSSGATSSGASGASSSASSSSSAATSGTTATSGAGGASASSSASSSVATGGAGGDTGATSTTGAGGAGGSALPPDPASPLPFVVDNLFVASGYMGDGAIPGAIAQDDNMTCATTRAVGAQGHCHKFTYTPASTDAGGLGWAGVYWQYPANNWGASPGKRIATGATKITFTAAGGTGGEVLNFFAGGINGVYTDAPKVSVLVTLTNTMAPYVVDLTGQTYDQVIGGFGWSAENPAGSTKPIVFTVDNIRWE